MKNNTTQTTSLYTTDWDYDAIANEMAGLDDIDNQPTQVRWHGMRVTEGIRQLDRLIAANNGNLAILERPDIKAWIAHLESEMRGGF